MPSSIPYRILKAPGNLVNMALNSAGELNRIQSHIKEDDGTFIDPYGLRGRSFRRYILRRLNSELQDNLRSNESSQIYDPKFANPRVLFHELSHRSRLPVSGRITDMSPEILKMDPFSPNSITLDRLKEESLANLDSVRNLFYYSPMEFFDPYTYSGLARSQGSYMRGFMDSSVLPTLKDINDFNKQTRKDLQASGATADEAASKANNEWRDPDYLDKLKRFKYKKLLEGYDDL